MAGCRKSKQSGRGPAFAPTESGRASEEGERADDRQELARNTTRRRREGEIAVYTLPGQQLGHTPFVVATVGFDIDLSARTADGLV